MNATGENISLELTRRCNSACAHCFARAGTGAPVSLDYEQAVEMVLEAASCGYSGLHLTGGEPLMWPRLTELIELALRTGYENVFINTNGTLVDREFCKRMAPFRERTAFSVSLQGPEDLHDSVRGRGSHSAASRGIKLLLESGLPVYVFSAAGKSLLPSLASFCSTVLQAFPEISGIALIQMIRIPGTDMSTEEEMLSAEDMLQVIRTVSLLNLAGGRVYILENPAAAAAARMLGLPCFPATPHPVRPGRLTVLADGRIVTSHSSRSILDRYSPGKIRKVIESAKYTEELASGNEICADCPFLSQCSSSGEARPSDSSRSAGGSPFCVELMRAASACTVSSSS